MPCREAPVSNIEIRHLLKEALTDDIHSRELYMKGIDHSYYYEGYSTYKQGRRITVDSLG